MFTTTEIPVDGTTDDGTFNVIFLLVEPICVLPLYVVTTIEPVPLVEFGICAQSLISGVNDTDVDDVLVAISYLILPN